MCFVTLQCGWIIWCGEHCRQGLWHFKSKLVMYYLKGMCCDMNVCRVLLKKSNVKRFCMVCRVYIVDRGGRTMGGQMPHPDPQSGHNPFCLPPLSLPHHHHHLPHHHRHSRYWLRTCVPQADVLFTRGRSLSKNLHLMSRAIEIEPSHTDRWFWWIWLFL